MKGLFRKRGGGKTTALVYTSAITGYPIVVPTTISKRYVKDVSGTLCPAQRMQQYSEGRFFERVQ